MDAFAWAIVAVVLIGSFVSIAAGNGRPGRDARPYWPRPRTRRFDVDIDGPNIQSKPRQAAAVRRALEAARPAITATFAENGVMTSGHSIGFLYPFSVVVWLGTRSDDERDRLPDVLTLRNRIVPLLVDAGLSGKHVSGISVITESQETVDRVHRGNWFYALFK